MPIEQALDKIFNTPIRRRTTLEAGIGGAGLLALPSIARAQEGKPESQEMVAGAAAASAESIAVFLKEFYGIDPLIWADVDKKGNPVTRLFAVVGTPTLPFTSKYGEDVYSNVETEYIQAKWFPEGTTRKAAIKQVMHDEDIPQILVLPDQTTHFSYFSVERKGNPLGRTPYIYLDLIIKPDAYPNAIVWFYEEANTSYALDPQREDDLTSGFFSNDMANAIKMFHSPEVPPNTFVYPDSARDDAKELLGTKLGRVIRPLTITKEATPPSVYLLD